MSDETWSAPPTASPQDPKPAVLLQKSAPGALPVLAGPVVPAPGSAQPVERRPVTAPRRDAKVGPPARSQQWLINQLPVGMLQSDFFVRFVSIFQELGESLLQDADLLEHVPDLTVCPTPMLSALAGWIGVDTVDESLPDHLQRLILASSARALAHRGTTKGLQEYLAMLSGAAAEVTDGGGVWAEGEAPADVDWLHMKIQGTGHLSEDELVAMIRDEIPAHVRAELWIGDRRVLNTVEEDR